MPQAYEPLSNLDAALLGMEDKTSLMTVAGLLTFVRPLDVERLKNLLAERWLPLRRMSQRIVRPELPLARPYWEDDPIFDLNAHVRHIALPAPGDQATLQEVVSDLVSMPLDYAKPPWQLHVVENYGAGGALVIRLHHALADGAVTTELLRALTDETAEGGVGSAAPPITLTTDGQVTDLNTELGRQIGLAAHYGRKLARRLAIIGLDALSDPEKGRELLEKGAIQAQSALQLALKATEPPGPFSGASGVRKQLAWATPLLLAEIQQIREALGGTLNDVMLTAWLGGVRRYLLANGQPVNGVWFRAAIPVNLRSSGGAMPFGNQFGVVFLTMPLAMANPVERLAEVRARMNILKQSPEAKTAYRLLGALSFAPTPAPNALTRQFAASLASAVITNVPGPTAPRYLAGQRIEQAMFWAPHPSRVGLAISMFSLAGKLHLAVLGNGKAMVNPDALIAHFSEEYGAMLAMANGVS